MNKKSTLIAASAATFIAVMGLASAALANDLELNANPAQIARDSANPLPWWWNTQHKAAGAYAYQPVQAPHTKVSAPKK